MEAKEAHLVAQMKNGSKEAFDALYERYRNKVFRMAYLIVGNIADSEDIAQETFVKCYLHCQELRNNEHFKTWLYQILHRTAWLYVKKKKREMPDDAIEERLEGKSSDDSLELIIASEESRQICEAVRKLHIKYRMVIIYYYFNHMPIKEIAKICRCTEGTVKSRLYTARQQLKKSLHTFYEKEALSYEGRKNIRQHNYQSNV